MVAPVTYQQAETGGFSCGAETMERVLGRLLGGLLDVDVLLDDIGDALDVLPSDQADVENLARRLVDHLGQLSKVALAGRDSSADSYVVGLVEDSYALRAAPIPSGPVEARQHWVRAGWTASELVDQLVEHGGLKGVV